MSQYVIITSISPFWCTMFVQAQINENTKAPHHWPLCIKSTGDWCFFPSQRASNLEDVSIWWRHHAERQESAKNYHTPNDTGIISSCWASGPISELCQILLHPEMTPLSWNSASWRHVIVKCWSVFLLLTVWYFHTKSSATTILTLSILIVPQQGKSEGFESCKRPIVRKRPIWVKIGDVVSHVTLKFDGWPWKTIGHLSFAVSSFVQHFIVIGEFQQELQSGNAQFGSNSTIFRAVWPWNFMDDLEKQ